MQQVEIIVQEPVTGPEPARLVYYAKRPATLTLLSVRDDALKLLQSRQTSSISYEFWILISHFILFDTRK